MSPVTEAQVTGHPPLPSKAGSWIRSSVQDSDWPSDVWAWQAAAPPALQCVSRSFFFKELFLLQSQERERSSVQ